MSLLAQRTPSAEALARVYGPLDKLDAANTNYQQIGYFTYGRLPVTSDVTKQKYPTRVLPHASASAARAGLHVAMRRPKEARALLDESLAADASLPDAHEVEGFWLDLDRRPEEAERAFAKAAERESENFYVYFRLASLRSQRPLDAGAAETVQAWLDRAARLNTRFAPTFHTLSWLHESQRRLPLALEFAQRAVKSDPTDALSALRLAEVLARLSRAGDAHKIAEQALELTEEERVRRNIQELLESLDRPSPVDASRSSIVAASATASPRADPDDQSTPASDRSAAAVPSGVTTQTGADAAPAPADSISRTRALNPKDRTLAAPPSETAGMLQQAPTLCERVDPVFPADATPGVDQGTVVVEIRIGPSGLVEAAKTVGPAFKFDNAALEAVRRWEYEPTIVDGKAVTVIMSVPINFGFWRRRAATGQAPDCEPQLVWSIVKGRTSYPADVPVAHYTDVSRAEETIRDVFQGNTRIPSRGQAVAAPHGALAVRQQGDLSARVGVERVGRVRQSALRAGRAGPDSRRGPQLPHRCSLRRGRPQHHGVRQRDWHVSARGGGAYRNHRTVRYPGVLGPAHLRCGLTAAGRPGPAHRTVRGRLLLVVHRRGPCDAGDASSRCDGRRRCPLGERRRG
ncbi:MAG: TonB family protein [Acidimicrobiia bacterium]|nr:TonB family protein [Acidimicrobiia bacterium]